MINLRVDAGRRAGTAAYRVTVMQALVAPEPFPESNFLIGVENTKSLESAALASIKNDSLWPEDDVAEAVDGHILKARKRAPLTCSSHSATLHNFLALTTEPYISSFLKSSNYVKGSVELPMILNAHSVVTTCKFSQPGETTLTMIVAYDIKRDGTGVMFAEGVALPETQESTKPLRKMISHTGAALVPAGPDTCEMIFASLIELMRLVNDEYVPAVGMADAFKEQFITNMSCTTDLINKFSSGEIPQ